MLLTDRRQATRSISEVVAAAVDGGARLVVLREKDLSVSERAALAERLAAILRPVGGLLIVASGLGGSGFDGAHLAAADPWPATQTGPAALERVTGRSCHSARDVSSAAAGGADYATLSPIFPSRSKPGYGPPLGVEALTASWPIPVYALGGVDTPERAWTCVTAGAAGVAVMGAIMRSAQPARLVARLLVAVEESR